MTRERLNEIFENVNAKWEGDNALQGLIILSKYIDAKKKSILQAADHDIIYGPDIDKILEAGLTEEDADQLRQLNWMLDDDCDSLSCFV